jgi:hypothetical protein
MTRLRSLEYDIAPGWDSENGHEGGWGNAERLMGDQPERDHAPVGDMIEHVGVPAHLLHGFERLKALMRMA